MSYVTPHLFDTAYNLTVSSGDALSSNLVTTVGLAEIDDGEGGIFAWSPTSLETDDGINVIQPSSVTGAGRWLRVSGQPTATADFTVPITVTAASGNDTAIVATGHGSGDGVDGIATSGAGIFGQATTGYGGYFQATSGTGAYGYSDTGHGVIAEGDATTPAKSALRIVPQDADPVTSPAAGDVYVNTGSGALKHYDGSNWVETGARYATASIASADIVGTSAGQLGHANGVVIVASPGVGYAIEFLSGVVILDFAGAAYTGGGNVTFNYAGGGAAVSTIVSNANSVTGAADKVALVLATAPTNNQLTAATGLNLVSASAPTQPGGATGVLRVKVSYRVHATGL